MSNENVELVESAFKAWNRGDLDTFADHAAEDVAWLEVSGRPEGGGLRAGRASGVEADGRWGYLISVRDGEMTRIEAYRDAADAVEAAGLAQANDGQ